MASDGFGGVSSALQRGRDDSVDTGRGEEASGEFGLGSTVRVERRVELALDDAEDVLARLAVSDDEYAQPRWWC